MVSLVVRAGHRHLDTNMPLADTTVRQARGRESPYKLGDGGGLYLLVRPDGARYWRMNYRYRGKQKTLALGTYPDIGLAEARKGREKAKALLRDGLDPSFQKKVDRITAAAGAANTFQAVADELQAKRAKEGKADATLTKDRWMLEVLTYPMIGTRPIAEIEPPELLRVLRRVEARGRFETARRLRSLCGRVFRYAIATGRANRDPAADLAGALTAPQAKHRAAILVPKKVGELLRAIEGYEGQPTTRLALKLAPLVFVRPGELRAAEWVEFELEGALWRIPAAKMKTRHAHLVPLSRQALAVLAELKPLTGEGRYLFPSVRTVQRCMSETTLLAALRRLGYGTDEMTTHGFRRIASTLLNEQGYNRDWIERQLAHGEQDEIRAAYNAAEYLSERRQMMQQWADYLDQLADPYAQRS
jgi:integrase